MTCENQSLIFSILHLICTYLFIYLFKMYVNQILEGFRYMTRLWPDPLFISPTVYRGCKPMAQASTTEPPNTLARLVV